MLIHGAGAVIQFCCYSVISLLVFVILENCCKRFLRHFDLTELAHALLAFLLLFEQLLLTSDITAVALRKDILSQRLYSLARYYLLAYGRLDRHLELVRRNNILEL